MKLAPAETASLTRRIARAIAWGRTTNTDRDYCNWLAGVIVADIDEWGTSASTAKRAVVKLAERIERTA